MPPASNTSRQQSQPLATKTPLSQSPLVSADVAKKKGKYASRGNARTGNTEAEEVSDNLVEPKSLSQSPDPSAKPAFSVQNPPSNVDSPVLDALGAYGEAQNPDVVTRTDSWARSIPFGKSPPIEAIDGIPVGESPPTFALSARGDTFRRDSPSSSPSQGKFQPPNHGDGYSASTPSRHESRDRQQRNSISTHRLSHPPAPHLAQPHFYTTPEVEISGVSDQTTRQPQEPGYSFCAVDTLPDAIQKPIKYSGNVVLVGREGSLEVLAIENSQVRTIGAIRGLSGRVIDAKILTWTSGVDPFASCRPLVSVSIHGPAANPKEEGSMPSSPRSDQTDLVPGVPKQERNPKREELPHVQTRVQVYSLRSRQLIGTLFATKPVPCYDTFPGLNPYVHVPSPAANLKVYASGNFVIVASGSSGEVLIYGAIPNPPSGVYQCLGKTWTSMQPREFRRQSNSTTSTDVDDLQSEYGGASGLVDVPIVSISGRWLAVVSPSKTKVSLQGTTPPSLAHKSMYGIDAHTAPPRPSVTCGVDSGEGESFLNKVARGLTQEVFKGARWIGDQGLQTWNNYWNKDAQPTPNIVPRRPHTFEQQLGADILPPTHAQETQSPSANDPDLVSIFDLKHLEEVQDIKSSFPNPVATFQPPNGCSFLSFSPNGLMLLTASKNGDVQYVWDLMQIRHCRARAFIAEDPSSITTASNPPAAHVRLMARYARLTTSIIRDVIWTAPTGEHLAIITTKGTVHVYDIPQNAFRWPPLRRITARSGSSQSDIHPRDEASEDGSRNAFSAAVKLVGSIGSTTQPILAAMRGRAPSVGAAFAGTAGFGIPSAAGVRGGKVVAAGLSKSVGAATETMNNIRHAGENRLHLSSFAGDATISKVAWVGDENDLALGAIDSGAFKVYQVERSASSQKSRKRGQSIIGGKIRDIRLPAEMQAPYGTDQVIVNTADNVTGFWRTQQASYQGGTRSNPPPLAQAEIETNAPYQPFHTDRRVNLLVCSDEHDKKDNSDQWVFGNDIPTTKVQLRAGSQSDGDSDSELDPKANSGEMENLISLGSGGEDGEHVVITTRRKRKSRATPATAGGIGGDEDGFFEDDCEVLDFARDRV